MSYECDGPVAMTGIEEKRKTQLDSEHVVITTIPENGESSMDPRDTSVVSRNVSLSR